MRSILFRQFTVLFLAGSFLLLAGCGGWGDYEHKSDRFKFKVTFPVKWEVWDRSDDHSDHLVATLPDILPEAKLAVRVTPLAPDATINEILPSFKGNLPTEMEEFEIVDEGTISSKKGEGRSITYTYLTEKHRIKGIRALFIGFRFQVRVEMEMPNDNFITYEPEFRKMISLMEL